MFRLKYLWQYLMLAVPPALAIIAALRASPIISIIAILIALFDIIILPMSKNNENAWMFFLTAITVTPINIRLIIHSFGGCKSILEILFSIFLGMLVYFVLLSAEEIITAIAIRILFPKQESFDDFEFTNSQ